MSIYKDCDIRGIYGEEFDAAEMRLVGRAIGRRLSGRRIIVAGDVRVSTPVIKEQLLLGLKDEGANITDIGTAPTPVAYFAKSKACLDAYALAIVTASHNPAKYNGIKLMFGEFPPTPAEIKAIENEVKNEQPHIEGHNASGSYEQLDVTEKYCEFMKRLVRPVNGLKVVLDIGNGATAGIAPALYRTLGYDVTELFGEPDGTFPNRNPNPADYRNLGAICEKVAEAGADFGVAFDGDGDRAVFVDGEGRPVINEKSLILLTKHAVGKYCGSTAESQSPALSDIENSAGQQTFKAVPRFSVVYDQKCSEILPRAINEMGGTPILERSGHAFIKKTFLENASILAGEISGHFFFKELGHDDGIYAGLCMGEYLAGISGTVDQPADGSSAADPLESSGGILSPQSLTLAEMADTIPTPFISPDLRYKVPYGRMDEVLAKIKADHEAQDMPISTYDGVRVSLPDGWFLVRKSVTEEAMTVKIEADSDARIEEIKEMLEKNYFAG